MHLRNTLAGLVLLALPVLLVGSRADADGILKRIHHHAQDKSPAEQTVVRLPAQEIRVETTKPRVVVTQGSSVRLRGVPAQGFTATPFVATIVNPGALQFGGVSSFSFGGGSSSMDIAHAIERQAAEISAARAHRQAIQNAEDAALQRLQGHISKLSTGAAESKTPASDVAQLKKAIEDMSNRLTAIEKLLIIHDDILKKEKTGR
jgi:hypothetical protein